MKKSLRFILSSPKFNEPDSLMLFDSIDQHQDHPVVDVEPSTSAFDMEILNEEEPSLHSVEPQV